MKFLLDQGIGRQAIQHLRAAGHAANHVGELGLATSPDQAILDSAVDSQSIVVTLDADFHQLLAMTHAALPSVIRIRIEGLKSAATAQLLIQVAAQFEAELNQGAVVSVTTTKVRARLLPIGI